MRFVYIWNAHYYEFYTIVLQTSADLTSIYNDLLQSIKITRTIVIGVCGSLALVMVLAGGIACYFGKKEGGYLKKWK